VNWEAVGAVGEVVGAIGVIATLIFLAFQVRQNSKLLKSNTSQLEQSHRLAVSQAIGESNSQQDAMLAIAQNRDLSDIFHRGIQSYVDLPQEERMRFALTMGPLIAGVATQVERQIELGVYGAELAADHRTFLRGFLSGNGGREYWVRYKNRYPPRFQSMVDKELNEVASQRTE
jgi:hypothetical protein